MQDTGRTAAALSSGTSQKPKKKKSGNICVLVTEKIFLLSNLSESSRAEIEVQRSDKSN